MGPGVLRKDPWVMGTRFSDSSWSIWIHKKSQSSKEITQLKEIIKFKEEISSLQLEVSALRNKTSELEAENVGLKQSELVFKEENKVIDITNLKDIL